MWGLAAMDHVENTSLHDWGAETHTPYIERI